MPTSFNPSIEDSRKSQTNLPFGGVGENAEQKYFYPAIAHHIMGR